MVSTRRFGGGCAFAGFPAGAALDLDGHHQLHDDGRRLIADWFERAWIRRDDADAVFEAFVFAWMSVNAWAACVTAFDVDREYVKRLQQDPELHRRFGNLMGSNARFSAEATEFSAMWPIFKAQQLRRALVRPDPGLTRQQVGDNYIRAGMTDFEPPCALWHRTRGGAIPVDWPHTLAALYRVRCNFFHGEKSPHSETDRSIVRAALLTLTGFFRGAGIL